MWIGRWESRKGALSRGLWASGESMPFAIHSLAQLCFSSELHCRCFSSNSLGREIGTFFTMAAVACTGAAVVGATVPVQFAPSSYAAAATSAARSVVFRGAAVVTKPLRVSRAQKSTVVKMSAEGGESSVALKVMVLFFPCYFFLT